MTRKFAVRVLAGVLLIAAGVLMIMLVYKPEMAPKARILVAGAFASLAFGGLAAIFGGWRGFLYGACIGTGLAALEGLDQVLTQPLSGIVTIAILALMVFAPTLIIRLGRHANPGADDEVSGEAEPLSSEETDALLLRNGVWVYQYLRDDEKIYIARVMSLADEENNNPLMHSAEDYTSARGNTILSMSNILGVQLRKSAGTVNIRLRRHDKGFTPWYEVMFENISEADAQVAKVFAGIPIEWKADEAPKQNTISRVFFQLFPNLRRDTREKQILMQQEHTAEGRKIICRYEMQFKVLLILSAVFQALWLFMDVDYTIFCVINLILPPISYLLYFYRMRAGRTGDKNKDELRLVFAMPMVSGAPMLRALLDYSLDDQSQLLLPVIVITLLFLLLLRLITQGKKPILSWTVSALVCVSAFYAPAASIHVNGILDDRANAVIAVAVITEMDVRTGYRSPTHYTLTLDTPQGEKDMDVAKDFYYTLSVGDEVLLVTSTGPLDITYSDVFPAE